jgi:uncharacterized protein involved in exopolysaccharide biosynthesis
MQPMTSTADQRRTIDVATVADEGTVTATPLAVVNLLLRNAGLIAGIVALTALLATTFTLVRGANYVAESRFTPHGGTQGPNRLAGLATQFGINVSNAADDESVDFYAELARSTELLREVASTRYNFSLKNGEVHSGTIAELYHLKGDTQEEKLRRATAWLHDATSAGANVKAGLVTLRTTAKWPELATLINRRLLDLINEFNVKKRKTSASAEREFVEARLEASKNELRTAEEAVQRFKEQNRLLGAPQLQAQLARLERQVDLQNQVYTGLATAYEQARVEEVRNTPVVTVVDGPEHSAKRAGGILLVNILIGIVVGTLLGIVAALLREYLRRVERDDPATYAEFDRLYRATFYRLRHPFRRRDVAVARNAKPVGQSSVSR